MKIRNVIQFLHHVYNQTRGFHGDFTGAIIILTDEHNFPARMQAFNIDDKHRQTILDEAGWLAQKIETKDWDRSPHYPTMGVYSDFHLKKRSEINHPPTNSPKCLVSRDDHSSA